MSTYMNNQSKEEYKEQGYLQEAFQIFHLSDHLKHDIPFHYHEFLKIFVLIRGNISYIIEGNEYELIPYDIVLIGAGEIHRPVIHDKHNYERLIIYLSPDFLNQYQKENLTKCFEKESTSYSHVIRCSHEKLPCSIQNLTIAQKGICKNIYAGCLLQKCRLLEFLIFINNVTESKTFSYITPVSQNENILKILQYINAHLTQNLSVLDIADAVHLSACYLMHKFKEETGYTIKEYITEKRLFLAANDIRNGVCLTEACYRNGFSNYSGFYRAYVKKYGYSPRKQKEHTSKLSGFLGKE